MSILVSGPVELFFLEYEGKTFIFLSDKHFSQKGSCTETSCQKLKCFTVVEFIESLVELSLQLNFHLEVFFELGYADNVDLYSYLKEKDLLSEELPKTALAFSEFLYPAKDLTLEKTPSFYAVDIRRSLSSQCYTALISSSLSVLSSLLNYLDNDNNTCNKRKVIEVYENLVLLKVISDIFLDTETENSRIFSFYLLCFESENFIENLNYFIEDLEEELNEVIDLNSSFLFNFLDKGDVANIRRKIRKTIIEKLRCFSSSDLVVCDSFGKGSKHRIKHQLDLLSDEKFSNEILSFSIQEILNSGYEKLKYDLEFIFSSFVFFLKQERIDEQLLKRVSKGNLKGELKEAIENSRNFTEDIIMDIYALSSILYSKSLGGVTILFAGYKHIDKIKEFLLTKGAKIKDLEYEKESERCFKLYV